MVRRLYVAAMVLMLGISPACSGDDSDNQDVAPAPDTGADSSQDLDTNQNLDVADTTDTAADLEPGDSAEDIQPDVPQFCHEGVCVAGPDSAPDPSVWGPYPVGVTTFTFSHQGNNNKWRKIVVEVWYPATEEAWDGPFENIDLKEKAPDDVKPIFGDTTVAPIPTHSVRDAGLRRSTGPYPLVIFSHGAFGIRFQSVFFTEYLASHGYIVVSPDHADNTLYDLLRNGGYDGDLVVQSAFDRPYDTIHLLDEMFKKNSKQGDFFYQSFDEDLVGVTGHSFGGFVSLLCPMMDSRFKAAVPMTPSSQPVTIMGYKLEDYPIPAIIMAGKVDQTLQTQEEMRAAYDVMPPPKYYFELAAGGHYTYTDICTLELKKLAEEINFGDAEDALTDGCGENNIPVAVAQPLIRQFSIGFLNYYLRGSTGSLKYFDQAAGDAHSDILLYLSQEQ